MHFVQIENISRSAQNIKTHKKSHLYTQYKYTLYAAAVVCSNNSIRVTHIWLWFFFSFHWDYCMSCCLAPTKPSPKSIIMRFNWNARIKWDFAEMFISMLVFLEMLVHKVPCTDLAHNEREKKIHAQTQVTIANAMLSIKQPFDIYNCTNLQTKSIIAIRAQFNWVAYDMDMNLSDLENLRFYWRIFFLSFLSLSLFLHFSLSLSFFCNAWEHSART